MRLLRNIWLFVALALVGCKTCLPVVEVRDSIRTVEVHTHDTAIVTQADSAQVQLLLRCDSANNVLIDAISAADGERIKLQYKLQQLINGQSALQLDCKEDSLRQVIQWQDSIIKEKTSTTIVQNVEVVPDYYKNTSVGFWVLLALLTVGIAIRIVIKIYLHK